MQSAGHPTMLLTQPTFKSMIMQSASHPSSLLIQLTFKLVLTGILKFRKPVPSVQSVAVNSLFKQPKQCGDITTDAMTPCHLLKAIGQAVSEVGNLNRADTPLVLEVGNSCLLQTHLKYHYCQFIRVTISTNTVPTHCSNNELFTGSRSFANQLLQHRINSLCCAVRYCQLHNDIPTKIYESSEIFVDGRSWNIHII